MSDRTRAWLERQNEKRDAAEFRVLGTCLMYPEQLPLVMAKLDPSTFKREAHRVLADTIWSLERDGKPVSMETVTDRLAGNGKLDVVGGPVAVFDVYAAGEQSTRAVEELLELEHRREVWQALNDGMAQVLNPDVEPSDVVADTLGKLTRSRDLDDDDPVMTTDELLALDVPGWLIDGIIPPGLTVLFGAPKSGKTYVAMQVAWSVATGTPFYRRKLTERDPQRVLYLVGEGLADVNLRARALVTSTDVHPGGNLQWWSERLSLVRQRDAAKLRLRVQETGAKLVVVDTWTRFSGLHNENDAGAAAAAIGVLEDLCHDGVSVLVVHHSGSSGERVRGSTVMDGAAESLIHVGRKYDDATGRPANEVTVAPHQVRRGTGFAPFRLKWFPVGPDAVLQEPWWEPPQSQGKLL